jgi:hypothetical protein
VGYSIMGAPFIGFETVRSSGKSVDSRKTLKPDRFRINREFHTSRL